MTAAQQRDSIERALIHHGIDYSPPEVAPGGVKTWLVTTTLGRVVYDTRQMKAYCQGLADREARNT